MKLSTCSQISANIRTDKHWADLWKADDVMVELLRDVEFQRRPFDLQTVDPAMEKQLWKATSDHSDLIGCPTLRLDRIDSKFRERDAEN